MFYSWRGSISQRLPHFTKMTKLWEILQTWQVVSPSLTDKFPAVNSKIYFKKTWKAYWICKYIGIYPEYLTRRQAFLLLLRFKKGIVVVHKSHMTSMADLGTDVIAFSRVKRLMWRPFKYLTAFYKLPNDRNP
jgi:hypothetical protein